MRRKGSLVKEARHDRAGSAARDGEAARPGHEVEEVAVRCGLSLAICRPDCGAVLRLLRQEREDGLRAHILPFLALGCAS